MFPKFQMILGAFIDQECCRTTASNVPKGHALSGDCIGWNHFSTGDDNTGLLPVHLFGQDDSIRPA